MILAEYHPGLRPKAEKSATDIEIAHSILSRKPAIFSKNGGSAPNDKVRWVVETYYSPNVNVPYRNFYGFYSHCIAEM